MEAYTSSPAADQDHAPPRAATTVPTGRSDAIEASVAALSQRVDALNNSTASLWTLIGDRLKDLAEQVGRSGPVDEIGGALARIERSVEGMAAVAFDERRTMAERLDRIERQAGHARRQLARRFDVDGSGSRARRGRGAEPTERVDGPPEDRSLVLVAQRGPEVAEQIDRFNAQAMDRRRELNQRLERLEALAEHGRGQLIEHLARLEVHGELGRQLVERLDRLEAVAEQSREQLNERFDGLSARMDGRQRQMTERLDGLGAVVDALRRRALRGGASTSG